jgi:hypothetical protein
MSQLKDAEPAFGFGDMSSSPDRLKGNRHPDRPVKSEHQPSAKVQQVLELINTLDTTPVEDQQIARAIVRQLESYHDEVVEEMKDDSDARHSQIVSWAVDADRLYRCRVLLESIDLD